MKIKFSHAQFLSLARAALQIGGTVAVIAPSTSGYVNIAGAALATIGTIWGQFNAVKQPVAPIPPVLLG